MTDCLELASKYSAKSIAFPTLGTGGLGHPHKIAASAMHKGICDFEETNQTTAIKYITIVVYDGGDKWKEIQQVHYVVMPPTLKLKFVGHIAFGLSVRACVCVCHFFTLRKLLRVESAISVNLYYRTVL